jgi:hypothetical protein
MTNILPVRPAFAGFRAFARVATLALTAAACSKAQTWSWTHGCGNLTLATGTTVSSNVWNNLRGHVAPFYTFEGTGKLWVGPAAYSANNTPILVCDTRGNKQRAQAWGPAPATPAAAVVDNAFEFLVKFPGSSSSANDPDKTRKVTQVFFQIFERLFASHPDSGGVDSWKPALMLVRETTDSGGKLSIKLPRYNYTATNKSGAEHLISTNHVLQHNVWYRVKLDVYATANNQSAFRVDVSNYDGSLPFTLEAGPGKVRVLNRILGWANGEGTPSRAASKYEVALGAYAHTAEATFISQVNIDEFKQEFNFGR